LNASQMPNTRAGESGFMHYVSNQIDSTLDWSVVDWITKLPVLVKGIMRGDDADEAVRRGVQGIIVSNHGGRQIDSAPATIEVLPEVVRAVLGRVPVFIDGGIRNGRDIFKSIALGANGVFVGRPILWGLSGSQGVAKVMKILQDEFVHTMQLAGRNCHSG
uniref:FMN hydroxy acid dehydrogenase domain-containing protein n=1 Tax=Angiostrongylus cantonensis TaxID=6313 RepID=A0A0K0DI62_ANGCA